MTEPVYKLEKLDFDGPLELLLRLIEKNKVDIYDIPIAEITRQYLEQMERLGTTDMEIISGFLVMAATLLDIKARMLVRSLDDKEEEEADPREELVARLIEYRRYRYIASMLKEQESKSSVIYYKNKSLPEELACYVPPLDLDELLKGVTREKLRNICISLSRRVHSSENDNYSAMSTIRRDRMSITRCFERLREFTLRHRHFTFRQLISDSTAKEEIVVSFLAVLELMRLGKASVEQEDPDGDIDVMIIKDAGLDDIDLGAILDE